MATKGILLLNLGTPEEPTAKGLRKFYKYFFSDPFVFDFNLEDVFGSRMPVGNIAPWCRKFDIVHALAWFQYKNRVEGHFFAVDFFN